MKKVQKLLISALCLAVGVGALTACGNDEKGGDDGKITITYYDATGTTNVGQMKVIKTEKIARGGVASKFEPEKENGYDFVNWFATPSKSHVFDFSEELTKNTSVYAGFSKYQADTRSYYIVGSGTSKLLFESNWGKVITDDHAMTKTADKNEYKITCDVKEGDEFQFAIDTGWRNQRGFGYMAKLADNGTEMFTGNGSVYSENAKTTNIKCLYSGNYTFTLRTYPGDDYYNTAGNGYSEEKKENYNMGTYDKIDWVRNGDVKENAVTITDFYIKGKNITNWKDMLNADMQMKRNGKTYTMSVYLKANDSFMFQSHVSKIENGETTVSIGSKTIKSNLLDATAQQYLDGYSTDGGNMTAKASGTYTFTYDDGTGKLTVAFDATKTPAALDYYIDGDAVADKWNAFVNAPEDFKLTETAPGSGVYSKIMELREGKEFQIRACKAGETPTTNNTADTLYQYDHMVASAAFERASTSNANIKVVTPGEYVITFDSYSKIITVTPNSPDIYDIYIKGDNIGTQTNWQHGFSEEYRMTISQDETKYEYTLIVTEGKKVTFGFAKYSKGETTGNGDFLGLSALGTDGDANAVFSGANNFECNTPGTYNVVYTIETGKIDFYTMTATE